MIEETSQTKIDLVRTSKIIVFLFADVFLQGSTFSQLNAFFEKYSRFEKNLSPYQYGIVMGAYAFGVMVTTPICAKIVTSKKFLDKSVLLSGMFIDSSFCMVMSLVSLINMTIPFFFASLLLRIGGAIGSAIGFFMVYVTIGSEVPQLNHILIPLVETAYGMAAVVGPAMSGWLYDTGGFSRPFLVIGGTLFSLAIAAFFLFPKSSEQNKDDAESKPVSLRSAWQFPVIVNVLCSLMTFTLISFNESTLALRLTEKFGMTTSQCGAVFLFTGSSYALTSLVSGFLSKKVSEPRYFIAFGQLCIIGAMILQAPLIDFEQTTTHVFVAQIFIGFGAGPTYVCSYLQSLRYIGDGEGAKESYAVLSAIFTPVTAIGGVSGPLVAGILREYFPYEKVFLVFTTATVLCFLLLLFTIFKTRNHPRQSVISMS